MVWAVYPPKFGCTCLHSTTPSRFFLLAVFIHGRRQQSGCMPTWLLPVTFRNNGTTSLKEQNQNGLAG